jgi:hypothetical protein
MSMSFDGYDILLFPESETKQKKVIGLIIHEDDSEFKIPIILDDKAVVENKYRSLMTYFDSEQNKFYIYLTQDFYKILRSGKNYAFLGIWHEIGHIHHNHYFEDDEKARQIRRDCIYNKKLNPYEFEADSFAVKKVSKGAVISLIDVLIRQREELNDANAHYALTELILRKKAIQRL